MQKSKLRKWIPMVLPVIVLLSCTRDYTNFYPDGENNGISIFSNTSNNILSCYIEGKPWRTVSRTSGGFIARNNFEVALFKQTNTGLADTVLINWRGYFQSNETSLGDLNLHLFMPAGFSLKDLSALQGRRINLTGINGFFSANIPTFNTTNVKGMGNIYFNTAAFDSVAPGRFTGKISGLFEANFNALKITNGRFDHFISNDQIHF